MTYLVFSQETVEETGRSVRGKLKPPGLPSHVEGLYRPSTRTPIKLIILLEPYPCAIVFLPLP